MITGCTVHYVGKSGRHHLALVEQAHLNRHAKTVAVDLVVFVRELEAAKFVKAIQLDQDGKAPGTFHWIEDWGVPPAFEEMSNPHGESVGDSSPANS